MSGYASVCNCHTCTCSGCRQCDPPEQDPEVREYFEWLDYLDAVVEAGPDDEDAAAQPDPWPDMVSGAA